MRRPRGAQNKYHPCGANGPPPTGGGELPVKQCVERGAQNKEHPGGANGPPPTEGESCPSSNA
eukprot:12162837-Heterocapsa_arctica.AAC.1